MAGRGGSKMEEFLHTTRNQNISNITSEMEENWTVFLYCNNSCNMSPSSHTYRLSPTHTFAPQTSTGSVVKTPMHSLTFNIKPCFQKICMALREGSFNVSTRLTNIFFSSKITALWKWTDHITIAAVILLDFKHFPVFQMSKNDNIKHT